MNKKMTKKQHLHRLVCVIIILNYESLKDPSALPQKLYITHHYDNCLHHKMVGDIVFTFVSLFVCLSVCLSVTPTLLLR